MKGNDLPGLDGWKFEAHMNRRERKGRRGKDQISQCDSFRLGTLRLRRFKISFLLKFFAFPGKAG